MKIKHALLIAILLFGTIPTLAIAASSQDALLTAVYKKDYALIDQLLKQGADINAFDSENLPATPLAVASGYGDIKLVNYLVGRGANVEGPEEFPNQAMYLAIGGNYSQVVNRFLD